MKNIISKIVLGLLVVSVFTPTAYSQDTFLDTIGDYEDHTSTGTLDSAISEDEALYQLDEYLWDDVDSYGYGDPSPEYNGNYPEWNGRVTDHCIYSGGEGCDYGESKDYDWDDEDYDWDDEWIDDWSAYDDWGDDWSDEQWQEYLDGESWNESWDDADWGLYWKKNSEDGNSWNDKGYWDDADWDDDWGDDWYADWSAYWAMHEDSSKIKSDNVNTNQFNISKYGDIEIIPYDGEINNQDDLVEFIKYTEEYVDNFFTDLDVDNADVINMLRESTRYGNRSETEQNLEVSDAIPMPWFFFGGSELGEATGFDLGFGGSVNDEMVVINGKEVDLNHLLVSADIFHTYDLGYTKPAIWAFGNIYNAVDAVVDVVGPLIGIEQTPDSNIFESYFELSKYQSVVDFRDVSAYGDYILSQRSDDNITAEQVLSTAITAANPRDLRGNIIGAHLGQAAADDRQVAWSKIIKNKKTLRKAIKAAAHIDEYENRVYEPLKNGEIGMAEAKEVLLELHAIDPLFSILLESITEIETAVQNLED